MKILAHLKLMIFVVVFMMTGSVAMAQTACMQLNWNASVPGTSAIDHYNIYRGGSIVGTSSTTSYLDQNLPASTSETYNVSAVDTGGHESQLSSPVTKTTLAASACQSGGSFQKPGPSQVLFNNPYYSCVRNFYVSTSGSDSNSGTASDNAHAWLTIQHADTSSRVAGDCVNVLPGTYAGGVLATHGGNAATSTGYVVYRCTTMLGCTITDPGKAMGVDPGSGSVGPSYLQFDGFELASSNSNLTFSSGFQANESAGNGGGTLCCHHLWFLNSKVHGYAQAGFLGGLVDFIYVLHNEFYDNAHQNTCPGSQGSGISIYQPTKLANYTYTADDKNNAVLGNMAYRGDFFRMVLAWNHIHNNYINPACGGVTDGNGIIFDDWANTQGSGGGNAVYAAHGLAMFNVIYNNGSNGIHLFSDENHTGGACTPGAGHVVANNSVYNDSQFTANDSAQSYRFDIDEVQSGCNLFVNNIAYTISPAGLANGNRSLVSAQANSTANGGPSTFDHNIVFCTGSTCSSPTYGTQDGSTASFTNITVADPKWTNVGNTSTGTMSAAPNGINFALQGTGPAIGFLMPETFLPAATRDAGACDRSFATCP